MSYILNALKKSEQERAGDASSQAKAAASLAAGLSAPPPKTRPTRTLVALAGSGAVALIAVTVWSAGLLPGTAIDADDRSTNLAAVQSENSTPTPTISSTDPAEPALAQRPAAPSVTSGDGLPRPDGQPGQPTLDTVDTSAGGSGPIADLQRVEEPTAGVRLPTQRLPRPAPDEPEIPMPLVALSLEPPMDAPETRASGTTPTDARSVVVVNQPPAPPDPVPSGPANSNSIDADIPMPPPARSTTKIVTVSPDVAAPDSRREIAAVTPPRADRASLTKAADLHEKGWASERSGNFPRALDAFTQAIDLRPDFADAYFGRAWIRDRMGQLDQATADYDRAITIEPKFAAAYGSRGVARFYLDQLAEAEADFEQTLRLGRGELRRFALLWRYLSAEHDGRDGAAQLAVDTRNLNLDRWPGVIARFYLGSSDTEQVLREARDPDPTVKRERLCVAYFFIAQSELLAGRAGQARDYFQKALETGVTDFIQYQAAQRELDRLASLR